MILKPGRQPHINHNPQVQAYYCGLESRIGYQLLLGGTRHFGFYERDTWWPFPVNKSLRTMEGKLAASLGLPSGSYVLDAGQIAVQKMDYHHLEGVAAEIFDGVYTSETFVHATDPEAVLAVFFRILKRGGRLVMHEYDHDVPVDTSGFITHCALNINEFRMLENAGFVDVTVQDYSENIKPMARLFYVLAFIPFFFVVLLRMERYFINTVGGFGAYHYRSYWRYLAITATKAVPPVGGARTD
ncbi:S-adenosyl-L-methionine-dependent methyltransferase [Aspergillus germanicus]